MEARILDKQKFAREPQVQVLSLIHISGKTDLLSHGTAGFKAGKAPPDHGYTWEKVFNRKAVASCGYGKRIQVEDRQHGDKPDNSDSPKKEQKAILQPAAHLHSADSKDNEE